MLDTFSDDGKIYISYVSKKDNCFQFNISSAKINDKNLEFDYFFSLKNVWNQQSRVEEFRNIFINDDIGLIFTIGDSSTPDFIGGDAQDDKSIYGKIIFKSFNWCWQRKIYFIFKGT